MKTYHTVSKKSRLPVFLKNIYKERVFLLMLLPGLLLLIVLNYIPMLGLSISFKNFRIFSNDFIENFMRSDWVGFQNFEFFIKTPDSFIITRNTILYNIVFIVLGNLISIFFAIGLNEIRSKAIMKFHQSVMLLPYILSWVVFSYLFFGFLSMDNGIINRMILRPLGMEPVNWYTAKNVWPLILVFANILKYSGYNCIIYLAALTGIDPEYYEAAQIDGASKWQQITKITIPLLSNVIIVMVLFGIGRIFNADFGLFYQVPMNSGPLFEVTNVIDTYVYRSLMRNADIGMSSAAGFYQSVVGFIFIMATNYIIKRIDNEKALF